MADQNDIVEKLKALEEAEDEKRRLAAESKAPPVARALGVAPGAVPTNAGMSAQPDDFLTNVQRPGHGYNTVADLVKILAQAGSGMASGGSAGGAISMLPPILDPETLRPALGAGNLTESILGGVTRGATRLLPKQMAPGALMEKIYTALRGGAENYANAADFGGNDEEKETAGAVGTLMSAVVPAGLRYAQRKMQGLPSVVARDIDNTLDARFPTSANHNAVLDEANRKINTAGLFPALQKQTEETALSGEQNSLMKLLADRKVKVVKPTVKGAMTNTREAQAEVAGLPGSMRPLQVATSPQAKNLADKQLAERAATGRLNAFQNASTSAETKALEMKAADTVLGKKLSEMQAAAGVDPSQFSHQTRTFLRNLKGDKTTLADATKLALKDVNHAEGYLDLLDHMDPDARAAAQQHFIFSLFHTSKAGKGGTIINEPYNSQGLMEKLNSFSGESGLAFSRFLGSPNALGDMKELAQKAVDADALAKKRTLFKSEHLPLIGLGMMGDVVSGGHVLSNPRAVGAVVVTAVGANVIVNIPHMMEHALQTGNWPGKAVLAYVNAKDPAKLAPKVVNEAMKFIVSSELAPKLPQPQGKPAAK